MTMHYHGTPITPRAVLLELAGRNFCVPFADPRDVEICHRIGQSVMLDNGAYSIWRDPRRTIDWNAWAAWAEQWLACPTTWAVLPDSIDGDAADNDELLAEYADIAPREQVAPVWHLHEPVERLERLVDEFPRVCFGSSGAYRDVGSIAWRRRVSEAFDAIVDDAGRVPWVHMLRGMRLAEDVFPFASLDSTNVAQNHAPVHTRGKPRRDPRRMADRHDAAQCPIRWHHVKQLELEVAP